mmetsp:Transcript_64571/g.188903  ORF Transcript_64571/g.188903 Transcript_64571/m.188903 type:complete len:301 (+) Transcript_64571:218-1120(+)
MPQSDLVAAIVATCAQEVRPAGCQLKSPSAAAWDGRELVDVEGPAVLGKLLHHILLEPVQILVHQVIQAEVVEVVVGHCAVAGVTRAGVTKAGAAHRCSCRRSRLGPVGSVQRDIVAAGLEDGHVGNGIHVSVAWLGNVGHSIAGTADKVLRHSGTLSACRRPARGSRRSRRRGGRGERRRRRWQATGAGVTGVRRRCRSDPGGTGQSGTVRHGAGGHQGGRRVLRADRAGSYRARRGTALALLPATGPSVAGMVRARAVAAVAGVRSGTSPGREEAAVRRRGRGWPASRRTGMQALHDI